MKKILLLVVFCAAFIEAQDKITYFPDDLNFQPLVANTFEPKLGFLFQTGGNELRLDIGNSVDLFRLVIEDGAIFGIGADLFTYTLLRGETDFHFPVDAVDYLFGLNATYKKDFGDYELGARLRLSHISAHFVDGHYDGTSASWRGGRGPQVYSREFIELIPYYRTGEFRFYAGLAYIFHVDPETLGKDYYETGIEYMSEGVFEGLMSPFAGYDLRITNLDEYKANHSLSVGVKFGKPQGKGFSIYYNYFSGYSIHGEYYDEKKSYSAFGINLDL
ncbi:MAG: DUF1207 domain-containing protein [Bacteroidetes bacterium]|nr:DUF1207 domain-containing protein [Bacteroidota bacterium]